MNEQRLEAYYQLIQSLLNCPSGEESEILAANRELLDADFVQVLTAVADYLAQQGQENQAERLRNLATYLTTPEIPPITQEDIETYEQFILETLQKTAESKGDPQIIYPFLAANTDKLDRTFAELLRRWATNTIAEAEPDTATYIAAVTVTFSNRIQQFPLGNKASNVEIAITGYKIALEVYTRNAFPEDWAMTQNNLGNAYLYRILGERANNLEQAISAYRAALEVYTRNAFPVNWAMTQNNLGNAYLYRILGERADNLELALAAFSAALEVYTRNAFPVNWAMTQNNLGNAYLYRILGERADNLELALAAFSAAQEVYTPNAFPQQWATTQNNVGLAYSDRILGERANNLELALAAYRAALEVRTCNAFPEDWAATQNNLGLAYRNRILGERANNLELAIIAFSAALEVQTRNAFPKDWAMTQNNLGTAYNSRILGERANNLELAIAAYRAALEVQNRNAFPVDWAMTQNNLGLAYSNRILGEQANNLELAIIACRAAQEVYTRNAFPEDWAATQNNLGLAYSNRILGERANNLELAIIACRAAQEVYTRNAFPKDWAMTQNNLGNAYLYRILGEKANNLELAISAFSAALEVYTRNAFPEDWAFTQNNLGNAYLDRILGERAENLELAIAAYRVALEVRTRNAFPLDWAATQNNLGLAYSNRILGEKANNLELAIAAYRAALEVYTRNAFPQNNAKTLFNLGILYKNEEQFDLTYNTFADAIATVEALRGEIISGEEAKRKQAEEWNRLYRRMVEVCLALGRDIEAIEYIERSKTRSLVELLLNRDFKTIFPLELVNQLEQINDKIASGQYQLQNGKAENPTVLAQDIQKWRQQCQELQDSYLPLGFGFKFEQFQKTLDQGTTIIEWYITSDRILTFVINSNRGEIIFWQSQPEDLIALEDWANEYIDDYYNQQDQYKTQWHNQLEERLKKLAEILHIEEILAQVPKQCERLILIPHRYLHLFPLHALPVKESYLIDLFPNGLGYTPSCQILQQMQMCQRPDFQSLFAIQNPTEDLNYTDLEVQVIQHYFNTADVLKKTAATLTAINNSDLNTYHCAHFSCHGYFNLTNPSKSALILANAPVADTVPQPNTERYLNLRAGETHDLDKCLTLDKIFSLKLEKCRLVTLSACETGLIDFQNTSDEYIGLPSGFLLAGSKAVVSSLWTVSDLSTAFLMMKFYENLFKLDNLEAGDIAIALKKAQKWLRNLTIEGLDRFLEEHKPQIEKVLAQLRKGQRIRFQESLKLIKQRQPLPFANPYYWAGFTASGR